MVLFANVPTALGPLPSEMTCSCVDVSTPLGVLEDRNPCRGLSKEGGGVKRLSVDEERRLPRREDAPNEPSTVVGSRAHAFNFSLLWQIGTQK